MKSNLTIYENALIEKLRSISGASAEAGYMAQYIDDETITLPFFALQPASESKVNVTNIGCSTTQNYDLVVAVRAGVGQTERMNDALFDLRSTIYKGNRVLSLSPTTPADGKFTLAEAEFFIPEGFESYYCAKLPVTIQYQDQF